MALLTVIQALLVGFPLVLWLGYTWLKRLRFEQFKSIPQTPPSLIWGHLRKFNEVTKELGAASHTDYVFKKIQEDLGRPEIVLHDLRPFNYPLAVVHSHALAEQIAKPSKDYRYSVTKAPTIKMIDAVAGPTSLVSREGEEWKRLRKRFNPGFAPAHLNTLIPGFVKMTRRFMDRLDGLAKNGNEFSLDELCTALTFDVIGVVVLDVDLNAQFSIDRQHPMVRQYRDLAASFNTNDIMPSWSVKRKRVQMGKVCHNTIAAVVKQRFADIQKSRTSGEQMQSSGRSVLDLSLKEVDVLTPAILQETVDQIKTFMFAGHDTTSITLQWALYNLSIHPKVLAKLRAEVDSVFPDKKTPIADQILQRGEECLSQLPYTNAVVKETLRLYPPAGSARMTPLGKGYTARLDNGEDICLDGMVLYLCPYSMQRDPKVYGDTANDFVPDRWVGNSDTLDADFGVETDEKKVASNLKKSKETSAIPQSAWRPFERGPRNCIGQELANIEARVILACAVGRYDFEKVGAGAIAPGADGRPVVDEKGRYKVKSEMFNRRQVTSKPFDDMMMKVRFAKA